MKRAILLGAGLSGVLAVVVALVLLRAERAPGVMSEESPRSVSAPEPAVVELVTPPLLASAPEDASSRESHARPTALPEEGAPVALPIAAAELHTNWPSFRGGPALNGVAGGTLPAAPVLRWSFQAGKSIVSSPVVSAGRLVIGCDDGNVYCLDAASGEQRWTHPTEDVIEAPPLIHDGSVYVGSSSGVFLALELASGALRWKHQTDDKILGGANWFVAAGGETRIVVGSYDSNLYCFAAADGAVRWKYGTGNYVNGTPAIDGGRIVFGGCDAVLHVVAAEDGAGLAKIELGSDAHVAGSVALDGGRVYLGHYGNAFVCADLAKNEVLWSFPDDKHPFFSSPALTDELVVFGGRNKQLHCLRRADGSLVWKFPTRRKVDGSPVIAGDAVVFAAGDGRIHVLALADGSERWSTELGSEIGGSVAVAGGWIYAAGVDGRIVAFGPPEADGGGKARGDG